MENSEYQKKQNKKSCLITEDNYESGLIIPKGMPGTKGISSNNKPAKMGNIYLLHKKFPKRHDNTQSINSSIHNRCLGWQALPFSG
jgi:hypothetical protein